MIIENFSQFPQPSEDYLLMNRDRIVAKFHKNKVDIINPSLTPFYFSRGGTLDGWLLSRSIDTSRVNSRKLKKVLRLKVVEDVDLVKAVHGATITDTYWIKKPDENLTYEQVKFKVNDFTKTSLLGLFDDISDTPSISPDLTLVGSLEKSWTKKEYSWFLLKSETSKELFSELLTFRLGELLGFYMARYKLSKTFNSVIESKDFTNGAKCNFEPMFSLVGDDDKYQTTIDSLNSLEVNYAVDLIRDYLSIIFLDSLVVNPDRHTFNYGLLLSVETGDVLAMAPNFDNNLALLVSNQLLKTPKIFIDLFIDLIKKNNLDFKLPNLNYIDLWNLVVMTNAEFNNAFDSKLITDFIMNNYNYIKSVL